MDRPDLDIDGLETAERAFGIRQIFVGAHDRRARRIERAKHLVEHDTVSLAEIALICPLLSGGAFVNRVIE
jgi:hypothetical protein